MGAKPPLTTEEKSRIALLTAEGRTPNYIAKAIGRDGKTVRAAVQAPAMVEQIASATERITELYQEINERILCAISDEDIAKASLRDKVVSAGISTDKHRLLTGQSTANLALIYALASMPGEE